MYTKAEWDEYYRKEREELEAADRARALEQARAEREWPHVRFWEYVNDGWVRLSLNAAKPLTWQYGGPHDEGYSITEMRWSIDAYCDPPVLVRNCDTYGRDCDGPHQNHSVQVLPICSAIEFDPEQDEYQPWKRLGYPHSYQVDAFAEAAGY